MTKKTRVRSVATQGSSPARALPSSGFDHNTWMISAPFPPNGADIQARRDWIAARYPESVVEEIAAAARFKSPEVITTMRSFLLTAGEVFKDQEFDRLPTQSYAPDKSHLLQISRLAADLISEIGSMNQIQAECFWHPMKQVHTGPASGKTFKTSFGLSIIERPWPDNAFVLEYLRPHQIIEAIQIVRILASGAADSLPVQIGGRNPFPALENWISSAQQFWRRYSSYAFAPVLARGNPASSALAFCYLAFKQLNGSIQPNQIASVMRSINKKFPDLARASRVRQKPR